MLRRFLLLLTVSTSAASVDWAWIGKELSSLPDGIQFIVASILVLFVFVWRSNNNPKQHPMPKPLHPDPYTRKILSSSLPSFGEFYAVMCPSGLVTVVQLLPGKELPHDMRIISDAEHKRLIYEARLCRELQIPDIVEDN